VGTALDGRKGRRPQATAGAAVLPAALVPGGCRAGRRA